MSKPTNTYGTEITSVLVGLRAQEPDAPGEKGWQHFEWTVTLTRHGETANAITFPYRMGVGHQQSKCGKPMPGLHAGTRPHCHIRCENAGWQPTPPDLYAVLTSLKADDPQGQTFADWCGNYGYDTDSRKAMDTYLACQESEQRSRKFFGADWQRITEDEEYQ